MKLLALAVLCAQSALSAPAAPTLSSLEIALVAGVSETRAAERVRELVALGARMGGTRSGRAAAERIATWFREAGLEASLVEDSETWCHEPDGWRVAARASMREGEGEAPSFVLERAWPFGFSPSARGSAPLALEPRAGVVWLAKRHERRERETGPLLELVDGQTIADGSYPMAEHLRAGDANPRAVFGIARPEGERLRAWLAEGRDVTIDYELRSVIRRARPVTAVGRIAAREGAPPGHFLFCAHGDSDAGGPGADDNASGEAVVLEIAQSWALAVAEGRAEPPQRELRFAIWGKEIHSTRDYLEREGERVLGVINFDQAGFGASADQVNVEPDDLAANVALVRTIDGALRDAAGREGFPPRWATNKSLGGTDSYVFSGSALFRDGARPSVTVFSSAWGEPAEHARTPGMPGESWRERELVRVDHDPFYHSAGDTPENTTDREPFNMAWCARTAILGAARWLQAQ